MGILGAVVFAPNFFIFFSHSPRGTVGGVAVAARPGGQGCGRSPPELGKVGRSAGAWATRCRSPAHLPCKPPKVWCHFFQPPFCSRRPRPQENRTASENPAERRTRTPFPPTRRPPTANGTEAEGVGEGFRGRFAGGGTSVGDWRAPVQQRAAPKLASFVEGRRPAPHHQLGWVGQPTSGGGP